MLKAVISNKIILPFYAKASIFLIGLFALFTILYIAQTIIVPIIFAIIIAIVLHPVVNYFIRKKINRVFSIIITLLLTYLVIASLGTLLFSQASRFSESWPKLVDKFTGLLNQTITWSSGYFNINAQQIHEWIIKTKSEIINTISASIGHTIATIGSGLVAIFLIPIYIKNFLKFWEKLKNRSILISQQYRRI